jgi:hypothetical protein
LETSNSLRGQTINRYNPAVEEGMVEGCPKNLRTIGSKHFFWSTEQYTLGLKMLWKNHM